MRGSALHHLVQKTLGGAQPDFWLVVKLGGHFPLCLSHDICSGIGHVGETALRGPHLGDFADHFTHAAGLHH